jgi:hypothetical protein
MLTWERLTAASRIVNASQWYPVLPVGTSSVALGLASDVLWEIGTCIVHGVGPLGDWPYMGQVIVA